MGYKGGRREEGKKREARNGRGEGKDEMNKGKRMVSEGGYRARSIQKSWIRYAPNLFVIYSWFMPKGACQQKIINNWGRVDFLSSRKLSGRTFIVFFMSTNR